MYFFFKKNSFLLYLHKDSQCAGAANVIASNRVAILIRSDNHLAWIVSGYVDDGGEIKTAVYTYVQMIVNHELHPPPTEAGAHIVEVSAHGEDGHDLGRDGDVELGLADVALLSGGLTDGDGPHEAVVGVIHSRRLGRFMVGRWVSIRLD